MFISIAKKEIKLLIKEKGTFFWLLVLPILFIVLFGSMSSIKTQAVKIPYMDQDQTTASRQFIQSLEQMKGIQLENKESSSLDEQVQAIKEGKLSALLVLPKGFESRLTSGKEQAELLLYRDGAADAAVAPVQAILQNMAEAYKQNKISGSLAALGKNETEIKQIMLSPLHISEEKENTSSIDVISQIVPGYTVMFVFFVIISMVRRFIKDKENGMTARLSSTPMRSGSYLLGMWLPYLLVVLIQSSVLLGFGHFVYNLHLGDLVAIFCLILALSICVTGIGLVISLFVKSENMGMAFTQLLTMGGAVVGGLWFPADMMPPVLQIIGKCTPQYWAQKGIQDVILRGAHLPDIWLNVSILLAFALVAMVLALFRFGTFMRKAAI
ncbi:multidrug ABC transporter permease [Paenibacillus larvae subsp. pulvifaciens]|uniref:Multidrug ABC transporter permease n=1 Tax=Paenibacillus larvae subsp. pulvifaciens TaxID=1477 RepID=A0A1V0UNW1_9BACL|nr:ABC transporter permease [Paenibacillus larvae]ARF66949.1 multidrug ABC transporter permease [Paenibacillus larvae subsp. pulvifaciens]